SPATETRTGIGIEHGGFGSSLDAPPEPPLVPLVVAACESLAAPPLPAEKLAIVAPVDAIVDIVAPPLPPASSFGARAREAHAVIASEVEKRSGSRRITI